LMLFSDQFIGAPVGALMEMVKLLAFSARA
jgi:hypothetical protein